MNVKLIERFGQPPNLPWWRLKNMSEQEIEQFNCGHMKEVEMSDIKGINYCLNCEQVLPDNVEKHVCKNNDVWNAAIDKCIEVANKYDSYGPAYEMRMLKK